MKNFKDNLITIYQSERGILILMILNLLLSIGIIIYTIINLNPNLAVVRTGYSDIGGYRDGSWNSLLVFPVLLVVFGIFHNLLALRIFEKRGGGMTKFFLLTTTTLILGTLLVFIRLLGES